MNPLDFEEQQLIGSVENGEWKSIDNVAAEIKKAQQYAKNTLDQMTTIYQQPTDYPLRGSNYQYNEPLEPATALKDFDSLQFKN